MRYLEITSFTISGMSFDCAVRMTVQFSLTWPFANIEVPSTKVGLHNMISLKCNQISELNCRVTWEVTIINRLWVKVFIQVHKHSDSLVKFTGYVRPMPPTIKESTSFQNTWNCSLIGSYQNCIPFKCRKITLFIVVKTSNFSSYQVTSKTNNSTS